jgi:hypothetical protein
MPVLLLETEKLSEVREESKFLVVIWSQGRQVARLAEVAPRTGVALARVISWAMLVVVMASATYQFVLSFESSYPELNSTAAHLRK